LSPDRNIIVRLMANADTWDYTWTNPPSNWAPAIDYDATAALPSSTEGDPGVLLLQNLSNAGDTSDCITYSAAQSEYAFYFADEDSTNGEYVTKTVRFVVLDDGTLSDDPGLSISMDGVETYINYICLRPVVDGVATGTNMLPNGDWSSVTQDTTVDENTGDFPGWRDRDYPYGYGTNGPVAFTVDNNAPAVPDYAKN